MNIIEELRDVLEDTLNIGMYVSYNGDEKEILIEFNTSNSYGEDVIFTSIIKNDNNVNIAIDNIIKDLSNRGNKDDFINEYVNTYNDIRGKRGVPENVSDLVCAAEENFESLQNIIKELKNILDRRN